MTKQNLIKKMYRLSERLTSGFHRDYGWEDLNAVFDNLRDNGFDVQITSTQYDGMRSKTYFFEVLEHKIRGHIICAFCGTVENPMERYDMSMILY